VRARERDQEEEGGERQGRRGRIRKEVRQSIGEG
jgi:hypothetical protein